jgi:endo-1,4-beta-D-glucanase Y
MVTSDGAGGFLRIRRPKEPGLEVNSSVSEGIAYGMVIAVYMNDQPLFDGLWKYWLAHTWTYVPVGGGGSTPTTLMNWYILANGNPGTLSGESSPSLGAATDADEDAAWALVMADKQWGGSGSLSKSYLQSAKDLLNDIWKYEIYDGKLPRNGSSWGDWNDLNISYFAPSAYRVFAAVTGNAAWLSAVVPTVYDTIEGNLTAARKNQQNGLVPAWTRSDGGDITANRPKHYQYDSCRTPFRIGLDVCFFGERRAITYVAKTSSFFSAIGAANIVTGYNLDGTPRPEFSGKSAAFVGPAAVGAMHSASYQSFVDEAYALIRQNDMNAGGLYYDESWAMLSILMMTGNLLDYTQY